MDEEAVGIEEDEGNNETKVEDVTEKYGRKTASFADAAKGKTQQQLLGVRRKYQHTNRFEISVYIPDFPENPTDDQHAAAVMEILKSLLKRFKHLAKRVAIVPLSNMSLLPAIERQDQILQDLNRLRNYIRNEGLREHSFRKGRNSRLLVNVTYDKITGGANEVQHLWQLHKNDSSLKKYWDIVLMTACMQKESYNPLLGSFTNSLEKQLTKALKEGLEDELGVSIEVHYHDIPAEYRTIEDLWKQAKNKVKGNIRMLYSYAPQALVVYTNVKTRKERMKLISNLNKKCRRTTRNIRC